MLNGPEFQACETCAAQPGSPTLCSGCLANRQTISQLVTLNEKAVKKLRLILGVLEL